MRWLILLETSPSLPLADAVLPRTASVITGRTFCENATVFVGATERSGGWPPPCRGAILSLPTAPLPAPNRETATGFAGAIHRSRRCLLSSRRCSGSDTPTTKTLLCRSSLEKLTSWTQESDSGGFFANLRLTPLESLKTPKKRNSGDSGGKIALSEALLLS